jgi:hypothetical protein
MYSTLASPAPAVRAAMSRKSRQRYEVHTRRELYPDERPLMTWALRLAIVLTMLVIAVVFRSALYAVLASVF